MPFLRFLWRCFGVVSYLPSSPNATGSGESSYSNGLKGVDEPVAIYAVATLSHPTDHRLQAHTVKRIFLLFVGNFFPPPLVPSSSFGREPARRMVTKVCTEYFPYFLYFLDALKQVGAWMWDDIGLIFCFLLLFWPTLHHAIVGGQMNPNDLFYVR